MPMVFWTPEMVEMKVRLNEFSINWVIVSHLSWIFEVRQILRSTNQNIVLRHMFFRPDSYRHGLHSETGALDHQIWK